MKKSRPLLWIVIVAALATAGYYGWQKYGSPEGGKTQTAQKGPPRASAIPVSVSPVQKTDFPVYLTGLGTVQGFNTVQVRSRVDGQIDKIAFTEGQIVKQDELLVSIDPGPTRPRSTRPRPRRHRTRPTSPTPISNSSAP